MTGFTLIEAVAALAICSAMVVALLGVRSALVGQAHDAALVARANVVAGELAGAWRIGQLELRPGEKRAGIHDASGLNWALACQRQEVSHGVLLKCLEVQVFQGGERTPLVSFDVWRPVTTGGLNQGTGR